MSSKFLTKIFVTGSHTITDTDSKLNMTPRGVLLVALMMYWYYPIQQMLLRDPWCEIVVKANHYESGK